LLTACRGAGEYAARNRAIILLLLDTGIRSDELRMLDLSDLDMGSRRLQIRHGKGRKQRVVPFTDAPAEAIHRYVDDYRGDAPGALLRTVSTSNGLGRLNRYHLGNLMRKLGAEAGVHSNPHRFRHTFATWAIEAGAREIDVQYLLGHSTSVMVRRYSSTYDASKAAINHAAFSPASRL